MNHMMKPMISLHNDNIGLFNKSLKLQNLVKFCVEIPLVKTMVASAFQIIIIFVFCFL